MHATVKDIHAQFAMKVIPRLLECRNIQTFKHRRGGDVKSLKIGNLVFCPYTYLSSYDIRYSIFKIVWLSSDKKWCILSRPSYNIRKYDPRDDADGYKKAVLSNVLKTRSSEQIYLLTPDLNIESDNFIPLDKIFRPFNLASLLKDSQLGSRADSFTPLSDPALNELINKHKLEMITSDDGKEIISVPGKQELDDGMLDQEELDDPLTL